MVQQATHPAILTPATTTIITATTIIRIMIMPSLPLRAAAENMMGKPTRTRRS